MTAPINYSTHLHTHFLTSGSLPKENTLLTVFIVDIRHLWTTKKCLH